MRVVSLVPSLTESLFALGLTERELVGRTAWCEEPRGRVESVPTLGGTKIPDLRRVIDAAPDLVILEREENRREAYDTLTRAGVPVFVAHVLKVSDVPPMLRALGNAVGRGDAAEPWARELEEQLARTRPGGPAPRAAALIWHQPLMAVAHSRYSGNLLEQAGFVLPELQPDAGYPKVDPVDLGRAGVELLLLTSEPHDFTLAEGEAIADLVQGSGFVRPRVRKLDGKHLTWFGTRTAAALATFRAVRVDLAIDRSAAGA